ncbi:MAG: hypothetical protein K6A82_09560 [Prevotella sp.]|nr:hypothetical protein [Prevotella sp.]
MEINNFRIADLEIQIIFRDTTVNGMHLLRSFEHFRVSEPLANPFFRLTVDDSLRPIPKNRRQRIRAFDTGNGDTIVDRVDDGSYQYIIKDIGGADCCLLESNKDFTDCYCALNGNSNMRTFGLNNALMLIFAFAGAHQRVLLIHASLVRNNDYGYAFIAKSGTGKSTQVSMWLRHIPGSDLMNDDNPIVRIIDGEAWIYGSPWSGKTPCYRNVKARLGAITRIDRATENSIEQLPPIEAFASLLPSCSSMKWDSTIYNAICDTITKVIETTRLYTLHCLPNKEAAEICQRAIAVK